jgi:hypothetical protein
MSLEFSALNAAFNLSAVLRLLRDTAANEQLGHAF